MSYCISTCRHGYLPNKAAGPLRPSRGAIVTSLMLGKGWKVRLCKSCSQQEACLLRTSIALLACLCDAIADNGSPGQTEGSRDKSSGCKQASFEAA